MKLNYTLDIEPHLPATDEDVKTVLDADPRTLRSIPRPDLRTWLSETGLMRRGREGWSGWLVDLAGVVTAIAPVIDWLCDGLDNPDLTHLRSDTTEAVAGGLAAIQAAYRAVPGGSPVPVDDMDARLDAWTGGRRYEGVTVEDVATARQVHADEAEINALLAEVDTAYHRARVAVTDGGVRTWPEVVTAFNEGS